MMMPEYRETLLTVLRLGFVLLLFSAAGIAADQPDQPSGAARSVPAGGKRPNVVLVITDDQGYGDIGAHGNEMISTPHLDDLWGQSLRLTDFHVSPCCTPTRAALMTGHDTVRTGAWGTTWGRSLPYADEVMMAEVFAQSGYRTGFFGKWHLGDNYPFRPQDRGFQHVLAHGGGGVGQTPDYWGNDYFDDTYFLNGTPKKFTGYCTDIWFNGALEFIEANKERPFFVYLSTNAPHGPLNVDPKYSDPYVAKGVPENMAKFYGMIENIDENMGRLMSKLDNWRLARDTILIFMTDNGTATGITWNPPEKRGQSPFVRSTLRAVPANGDCPLFPTWAGFNAGMRGKKGSYYDGGHRVPCFIRWPAGRLGGGRDMDTLCAHVDVLPTLIDLCGLQPPEGVQFDGTTIGPLLKADTTGWPDRTLFAQYRQSSDPPEKWKAAVMTERWRLVGGTELYDIQADPGQANDVAEEHPEVVARLRADYEAWWADVARRFDEYSRIVLGSDAENPARLTCFDWHTRCPWSQRSVLAGVESNSFWAVTVAASGRYRFFLRRWPEEADAPITAALAEGKAIRADQARLKIGSVDQTKPIPPGAKAVVFEVELVAGDAMLETWLVDTVGGQSRGAYYVCVTRLAD